MSFFKSNADHHSTTDQTKPGATSRQQHLQLLATLESSDIGLWQWDLNSNRLSYDATWLGLLGHSGSATAADWDQLLHPADQEPFQQALGNYLQGNCAQFASEQRLRTRAGQWRWMRLRGKLLEPASRQVLGGTMIDIDAQHRKINNLERMALYDPLTGLPNRFLLQDRLQSQLHQVSRHNRPLALLYIEIPRLLESRDPYLTDKLLLRVTRRLQSHLRRSDTIARFNDEHFVVLMGQLRQNSDSEMLANRLLHALTRPLRLGQKSYQLHSHIGLALYPDHARRGEELLQNAQRAMQMVKLLGEGGYRYAAD